MTTASTVKEHPILFRPEMVRAILDGRKTQTRRVVRSASGRQAEWLTPELLHKSPRVQMYPGGAQFEHPKGGALGFVSCPYGQVGDRLWVKETWLTSKACDGRSPSSLRGHGWPLWYVADGAVFWTGARDGGPDFVTPGKTRVSIHMPRWASRITLEITGVRVERLHEITESDAEAEGARREVALDDPDQKYESTSGEDRGAGAGYFCVRKHRYGFRNLWHEINGAESWDANPWVWVISFKRIGD